MSIIQPNGYCISVHSFTAAIKVVKVLVDIVPFGDHVIPVAFKLKDDKIIEPMEFYHLTIVNISDPSAVVGDVNTTYIIVHDDDKAAISDGGKM